MLAILSALFALGCVLASVRRLAWVVAPTSLDPRLLLEALRGEAGSRWRTLGDALMARDDLPWERDLFAAFAERDEPAREAAISEQLLDLDWRVQRWSRVPRVCASIASSAGFLCASVALMRALSVPAEEGADSAMAGAALISALDALAVGIAGTAFCVAVHVRTRRLAKERVASAGKLIERLRTLAAASCQVR